MNRKIKVDKSSGFDIRAFMLSVMDINWDLSDSPGAKPFFMQRICTLNLKLICRNFVFENNMRLMYNVLYIEQRRIVSENSY